MTMQSCGWNLQLLQCSRNNNNWPVSNLLCDSIHSAHQFQMTAGNVSFYCLLSFAVLYLLLRMFASNHRAFLLAVIFTNSAKTVRDISPAVSSPVGSVGMPWLPNGCHTISILRIFSDDTLILFFFCRYAANSPNV